jgi:lipopolysaccharide/colanic/teichoic acid biosynthesis glycosyltransferase
LISVFTQRVDPLEDFQMFKMDENFVSEETFPTRSVSLKLYNKSLISEESFKTMVEVERKRSDRSGKPFLVMLLDLTSIINGKDRYSSGRNSILKFFNKVVKTITVETRDIDIKGWYETGKSIGILFTEITPEGKDKILEKINRSLRKVFREIASRINISCHWYPMDHSEFGNGEVQIFYPDPSQLSLRKKISRISKRSIDILGSLLGLLIFSPVFLVASIIIKCSSAGPVFFRQERVGKGGKIFRIYKFRTMTVKNDESEHREYMKQFIRGQAQAVEDETTGMKVFKMTNDSRVTSIGKILRKTSLDEVPQFINVLLGDMSLVGPRPPIPYEFKEYNLWHRRRVLESKPGITGYWQIEGRSMTSFDGMVRMDIRYINTRSTLFDLKVILKTPLALFTAKGAY